MTPEEQQRKDQALSAAWRRCGPQPDLLTALEVLAAALETRNEREKES